MSLSETLSARRIVRTAAYLAVEFVVLYGIMVGGLVAYLHFGLGAFSDMSSNRSQMFALLLAIYALILLPMTLAAVTIGLRFINGRRGDEWRHGAYDPVRPVAMLARAVSNTREERRGYGASSGKSLVLAFSSVSVIDSVDVIARLSALLDRNGMDHTSLGGILVRDGDTRWGVDPDLARPQITVWCDSDNAAFREQVFAGVRDFLENDMGLAVE